MKSSRSLLLSLPTGIFLLASRVDAQTGGSSESFASGLILPAALALFVGIGIVFLMRYLSARSGKSGGLGLTEDDSSQTPAENTARPEANPSRKRATAPPNKSDLARAASSENANFSRNYAQSLEISHLPIGQIQRVEPPLPMDELPDSDDDGLLAAIDELQDDSDADSEFRTIALRVLAGFKTRNSVEALAQIALYDLSGTLRAKAVSMLADFDHESVFETIVLACADPSREVRAAGAKALVKVSFDRANEWARFAFSSDLYLSRQIARAAVEAGIAERSFDRLVLRDEKAAYEALALVFLLVKAGETDKIFEAIKNHRDIKTRIALLHTLKIANVAEVIPQLSSFIAAEPMSSGVADKAREVLLGINALPVNA